MMMTMMMMMMMTATKVVMTMPTMTKTTMMVAEVMDHYAVRSKIINNHGSYCAIS